MFGIDTFSWQKIILLINSGWREKITSIFKLYNFFVTHEVVEEFKYRFPNNTILLDYVTLLPKINYQSDQEWLLEFDSADISLIEYSKKKDYYIITEDHPMLALATVKSRKFIQIIDFFRFLNADNNLSNNELWKLVKYFRKNKNITKHKEKQLLSSI